jgi:hypothetical protein
MTTKLPKPNAQRDEWQSFADAHTPPGANAQVTKDIREGWLSFFVVLNMACEAKGLSGPHTEHRELRDSERDDLASALIAGEVLAYSGARRSVPVAPSKLAKILDFDASKRWRNDVHQLSRLDLIVNVYDVLRWYAKKALEPIDSLKLPDFDVVYSLGGSVPAAAAQLNRKAALPAGESPKHAASGETSGERCARLLLWLREEQARGERGALARVVRRDGRARQTVTADIKKAREDEAQKSGAMSLMARSLKK